VNQSTTSSLDHRGGTGRRPGELAQDKTERVITALALSDLGRCVDWGRELAGRLSSGARLLVAGNGGSAAQAQHLSAELVGRYLCDRRPLSAIALHADTSSLTAICNDFGPEEAFARQVEAHGRRGDVVLLLSTSGTSPNVLAAAERAREMGLTVWAMTGPGPNPLAARVQQSVNVPAHDSATVQEVHMVAVHLMCEALDSELAGSVDARSMDARSVERPSVDATPMDPTPVNTGRADIGHASAGRANAARHPDERVTAGVDGRSRTRQADHARQGGPVRAEGRRSPDPAALAAVLAGKRSAHGREAGAA
jgi:phosphoheptose isomerase